MAEKIDEMKIIQYLKSALESIPLTMSDKKITRTPSSTPLELQSSQDTTQNLPKLKKTMHISEIMIGGLYVAAFIALFYWFGERIGLVPIINIKASDGPIADLLNFSMNYGEMVICMVFVVIFTWTLAWISWFGLRKYQIKM